MDTTVVSSSTVRRRARRDVDRRLQQIRDIASLALDAYKEEEEEEDILSKEMVVEEIKNDESPHRSSSRPTSSPHRSSSRPTPPPHRSSSRPAPSPHWSSSCPMPSPHRSYSRPTPSPHRSSSSRARPVSAVSQSLPRSDTPELFKPSFRVRQAGLEAIPCTAAELHIFTLLEHMKHQLTQLTATVNSLSARMDNEKCSSEMPEEINFPCGSLEEVDSLEQWLKEPCNAAMKKNMISALGSIGGEDTKRVTWNILAHIFSDSVAKKINWKGANGKKAFNQMATKALLARAVRKSHVATKATDLDINKHIIRWFNLASDRGRGHRERNRVQAAPAAAAEENLD